MNLPPPRPAVESGTAKGRYPTELERVWEAPGAPPVTIRALRPDDIDREERFVAGLSPQTLYLRLQYVTSQTTRRDLERLLDVDYYDRLAVGAFVRNGAEDDIIGVSRYARIDDTSRAECAIVVADDWHGRGVGTELMRTLIEAALARDITCLEGSTLPENLRTASWARRFGFGVRTEPNSGGLVKVTIDLGTLAG